MTISNDSQAILLLCSHLGITPNPEPVPFTLKDWNQLAKKLQSISIRPGALLGLSFIDIKNQLDLNDEESERIFRLLQRSGSLAIELERLASLGILALTRADEEYPTRYRQRLRESAPTVLFFAGEKSLIGQPGIAVVGSRHLDEAGQECAEYIGNACGLSGEVLYSGGAKGVDTISMTASLNARGTAVEILAESLEKAIRNSVIRTAISRGDLCLATPYSPNAPFSVGAAMGRNKLIYSLADFAIIVASDAEIGGTWSGAIQALKAKWLPVFVLEHPEMPKGNMLLIQKGALRFPHPFQEHPLKLRKWLESQASHIKPDPQQPGLGFESL